jgi:hypothetical protein
MWSNPEPVSFSLCLVHSLGGPGLGGSPGPDFPGGLLVWVGALLVSSFLAAVASVMA